MKKLLMPILLVITSLSLYGQAIYNADGIELKHVMTAEEAALYDKIEMPKVVTAPPTGEIRPVAEFEPCEAVLIRYPLGIPYTLVKELAEHTKLITLVSSYYQAEAETKYQQNGVNLDNCEFLIANTDTYWTRDYGPWFMAIDNEKLAIYDFTYNRPRPNDNAVNTKVANFLSIEKYSSDLEACGGNYMVDSKDQAASTDLILEENPNYTTEQIHQHFKEYLGIENYIISEDPLQDYIKHIDCWGKFLAPNKVMIGQVPQSDPRYNLFEEVAEMFGNTPSAWGMNYEVYRVYTPGSDFQATPYANTLILNNKVFVAQSGSQHDAAAIQAYQNAMPGYEIVGIPYGGWKDTDALHCRTHEINDREMLYISHLPVYGNIEDEDGVIELTTEIYSYGGHTIYSDSVIAYVRTVENGEYQAYNFTNTKDNTWTVSIPGLQAGKVEYYIYAADNSGRRECHPYIGAPDPHDFVIINENSPSIEFNETNLNYEAINQEEYVVTKTIANTGNQTLNFNIDNIQCNEAWLSVTPANGQIEPNSQTEINIMCSDIAELDNGTYNGTFEINSNDPLNPTILVEFELIVYNFPVASIETSNLNFNTDNNETEYSQKITISNLGKVNLTASVSNIIVNSNINWLSAKPEYFNIPKDTQDDLEVIVSIPSNTPEFDDEGVISIVTNDEDLQSFDINVNLHHSLGIEGNDINIVIYPNPFREELNIQGKLNTNKVKIVIYNLTGELLKEEEINVYGTELDYNINTSELPNGLYFYKLVYDDNILTGKIVKK